MDSKEIYRRAIMKWGPEAQQLMAIQEMAELTQAITKAMIGKPDMNNLMEEIADVEIMLEQLKMMMPDKLGIEIAKDRKLKRLEGLVV